MVYLNITRIGMMTTESVAVIFQRVGFIEKLCLSATELEHCKAVYHAMQVVGLGFTRLILSEGMKQPALLLGLLFGSRSVGVNACSFAGRMAKSWIKENAEGL